MDALFYRDAPQAADEPALSPDAMRDSRRGRMGESPVPMNDPMFLMGMVSGQSNEEEAEPRSANWLSPMEFLQDDDLFRRDEEEDVADTRDERQPRMEELDWNTLGEQLVELERQREAEAAAGRDEESGDEENRDFSIRDREVRGLTLGPVVAPTGTQSVTGAGAGQVAGQGGGQGDRTNLMDAQSRQGAAPLLAPALRMDGPVPTRDDDEVSATSLPGSRAMFEEIGRNWQPEVPPAGLSRPNESRPGSSPDFGRMTPPVPRERTLQAPPSGSSAGGMTVGTPGGIGQASPTLSPAAMSPRGDTPAMRPSMGPSMGPTGGDLSGGAFRPVRVDTPSPAPAPQSDAMDIRRFRDDEFRIRPSRERF